MSRGDPTRRTTPRHAKPALCLHAPSKMPSAPPSLIRSGRSLPLIILAVHAGWHWTHTRLVSDESAPSDEHSPSSLAASDNIAGAQRARRPEKQRSSNTAFYEHFLLGFFRERRVGGSTFPGLAFDLSRESTPVHHLRSDLIMFGLLRGGTANCEGYDMVVLPCTRLR